MASSGDAPAAREGAEGGGDNNSSAELYESERGERSGFGGGGGGGGNRWPRQETVALLKIRSDMDALFRDASVKGPLWEEVSRKLGELGFHRSAKKCKEKFENVYKYHKRTKDGRTGKHEKKTYRFFDQLEALENLSPSPSIPPAAAPQMAAAAAAGPPFTVTSVMTHHHIARPQFNVAPLTAIVPPAAVPSNVAANPARGSGVASSALPNVPGDLGISDASVPSSSSTSSDEELVGPPRRGTKRKWRGFFERLTKEVMDKQEAMHKKFLEVIEKREHERMAREETWRVQEVARINQEREILAQERSAAASKDAAVMSFLQKIAEQQIPGQAQANPSPAPLQPQPQPPVRRQVPNLSPPQPVSAPATTPGEIIRYSQAQSPVVTTMEIHRSANNGDKQAPPSSSRWPKVEVEALIKLRSNLESKYQENGPKGPLWEEISAAMRKFGYNRSSKRCKEKWENINKYYKKVKESNKQRPEDSKTCPYFHQLDALYREKSYKVEALASQLPKQPESSMAPLMVTPEQQWPPPPPERRAVVDSTAAEDMDSDRNHDEEEGDEEDDEEGDYEVVANKPSSAGANSEDTRDC